MRVLTDPNELESLLLPEPALLELLKLLVIPNHNPQEMSDLWQELPARLIYFEDGDLPEVLLMALLSHLSPPEYEVPLDATFWLRLHLLNDYGAGLYLLYTLSPSLTSRL